MVKTATAMSAGTEWMAAATSEHDRTQCGADQWDQVGDGDEERDERRERDSGGQQHEVGGHAADHRDQEVARQVAGDRLGAVPGDGACAPGDLRVQQVQGSLHDLGPLEHHEVGQDEDGEDAGDAGGEPLQETGG